MALIKTGREVAGLDICYELLERARKRGLKNLVQADALKLPFVSSSFDLVVFPESIGYFALHEGLPGVARVLKQRGRLLITAYATNFASDDIYKKTTVQGLTKELQAAGFSVLEQKLLTIKKSRVIEVSPQNRAEIIYILARKQEPDSRNRSHKDLMRARG